MNAHSTAPTFIALAPMEGIIDHTMRELFSAIGGIDRCVTEFVRVSQQKLPKKTFRRYCPELDNRSHTRHGTPVYVQLLGDNPELMAQSACSAVELGACGIDINFGCPAKTVNNSGGGAVLLQYPDSLQTISSAIRQAIPKNIPLTAKMRLGYHDKSLAIDNAQALEQAGVSEIIIHARTKAEGYRPPAFWHEIAVIREHISIPVIANGEIWSIQDMQQCQQESGCQRLMLGRGLVACPDLALFAKGETPTALHWGDICLLLLYFFQQLQRNCAPRYITNIIKQWLVYLRIQYPEAYLLFEKIKRINKPEEMLLNILAELNAQKNRREITGKAGNLDLTEILYLSLPIAS